MFRTALKLTFQNSVDNLEVILLITNYISQCKNFLYNKNTITEEINLNCLLFLSCRRQTVDAIFVFLRFALVQV